MKEITNYAVRIHGGPNGSGAGKRASIHLFSRERRMVGIVDFWDSGVELGADAETDGRVVINLHIDLLSNVVDLLRNERPIYIGWQRKIENAYLGSAQEHVGEGDGIGFK